MKFDTIRRKKATKGFRQMTGNEHATEMLANIISNGKQALDEAMLGIGKMVAESIMLMDREELSGPDYAPIDPRLQKWAYEDSSVFIGGQKVKVKRPRLRNIEKKEIHLQSYEAMKDPKQFSNEMLEKILRGMSMQKYRETLTDTAKAFGVSPSSISQKIMEVTSKQLEEYQQRSLKAFIPFAIFLDTIHRGKDAFIVAIAIDRFGNKQTLGFWQGASENNEVCKALFSDLEKRGLPLSNKIIFITDGGGGIIKALRDKFGKKLIHQRCTIHKSRNIQKHLAKKYRHEAHNRLRTALEHNTYADAKKGLTDFEKWLRNINESAADSLLEAFEELLTVHKLKVMGPLKKTLLTTNPIESMFSLVRHCERNIKRSRGSRMEQRWLASVLLYCEKKFRKVKGFESIKEIVKQMDKFHEVAMDKKSTIKMAA